MDLWNTTLRYSFHFQYINLRKFPVDSFAHDTGRTLVRAEYGYPKGSPNIDSYSTNSPLQLSIQCSPQRTPKRPINESHGATRQQQAIAKAPAE
jgi:hypothetical protein